MYSILQDNGLYNQLEDLQSAINTMTVLGESMIDSDEETTFTVKDKGSKVVASITNKKIMCTFFKQEWGGRKSSDAYLVGEEEIDATNVILKLPYEQLIALKDNTDSTDTIGRLVFNWDGPYYVHVTDAVCEYFGVYDVKDITQENYDFVKSRVEVLEPTQEIVTLQIQLKVNKMPGADMQDFLDNIGYDIFSKTVGVVIENYEIIESRVQDVAPEIKKSPRP